MPEKPRRGLYSCRINVTLTIREGVKAVFNASESGDVAFYFAVCKSPPSVV